MQQQGLAAVSLLVVACLAGCRPMVSEPPVSQPAPPAAPMQPQVLQFEAAVTNAVARPPVTVAPREGGLVQADFNRDGLDDMAVVERAHDGGESVGVYIRTPPAGADRQEERYFRIGAIRRAAGTRVRGVMSSQRGDLVDLAVIFTLPSGENEIAEFRNTGAAFVQQMHRNVFAGTGG